jgi:Organic Anion Transporter Polypeptide (OATP) family
MSEMNKEETSGKFSAIYDNDDNLPDYSSQKANSVISYGGGDGKKKCNGNNNGLSNNEYKMDMKVNGNAEEDPLTGAQQQNWHLISPNGVSNNVENPRSLKWRQRFASTNFFMVIFLVAYILQGCYFTYFVSVITTIERLFHIKSASIALLLNFSEVGQICTSLILTYFAGRGHRPRWIACGMFLFSIAAFGSVSPHFIYRDRLYNRQQLATANIQQQFANESAGGGVDLKLMLCDSSFTNNTIFGASCEFSLIDYIFFS